MSDTPRTDTVLASYFNPGPSRLCDLARELERELNSANAAIRQQRLLEEENLRIKDRIKRLEEQIAGLRDPETMRANLLRGLVALPSGYGETGPMEERIKRLEEAGDRLLWMAPPGLKGSKAVCAKEAWAKAKESKP